MSFKVQSQWSLHFLSMKGIGVSSLLRKRLLYIMSTIRSLIQKILFFGKKGKASVTLIKEGLETYININF